MISPIIYYVNKEFSKIFGREVKEVTFDEKKNKIVIIFKKEKRRKKK